MDQVLSISDLPKVTIAPAFILVWRSPSERPGSLAFHGVKFGRYPLCDAIYNFFSHSRVESRKKTNCLGKTFLKMWPQIYEKKNYVSKKLFLRKKLRKKERKNLKASTIFSWFWGQNYFLLYFQNSFPLTNFWFSF